MKISYVQLASLGLVPGQAEELESIAQTQGKSKAVKVARDIQSSRNVVYIGLALTLIGFVGDAFGAHCPLINASIASVGGLLLIAGGTKLGGLLSRIRTCAGNLR